MEPPELSGPSDVDHATPEAHSDLDSLEARVRALEERLPSTQLLNRRFLPRAFAVLGHYLAAGLIIYAAGIAVALLIGAILSGTASISDMPGEAAVPEGPALSNVASLPLDAGGVGTIQGAPTGEAATDNDKGSFVLVLEPAPKGLPERTTVNVGFDKSTKVYRDGRAQGNPLDALNEDGPVDADPTAAGTVVVRFRIRDGAVFADRLELSDEYPSDGEP